MVIAAENDLLLPSTTEAERLKDVMLRAFVTKLPGKSHAFMEESGVNLLQILKAFVIRFRNQASDVCFRRRASISWREQCLLRQKTKMESLHRRTSLDLQRRLRYHPR